MNIDSWTISRLVDVQRWPQVPTAPKILARIAISKSALGVIIIALLPPNSNMVLPSRAPTFFDTFTSNTRVGYNPWKNVTSFEFVQ